MSATNPESIADSPAAARIECRLQEIEKRLKELKPSEKDGWDKFEKVSSVVWSVVTLLVSIFVTSRIENALKERELHLENVKDMQALMQQFDDANSSAAMSYALALGAHGRYAVAPMIQALQTGKAEHRPAAMAGLRAAAAIEGEFVCHQLIGVIRNRTRLYQVEVHSSAAQLLGDLNCRKAIEPLSEYVVRLDSASPANAPFTPVPATTALTPANIDEVKKQARASLDALNHPY